MIPTLEHVICRACLVITQTHNHHNQTVESNILEEEVAKDIVAGANEAETFLIENLTLTLGRPVSS